MKPRKYFLDCLCQHHLFIRFFVSKYFNNFPIKLFKKKKKRKQKKREREKEKFRGKERERNDYNMSYYLHIIHNMHI